MRLERNSDKLEQIRVRSVLKITNGKFEHCSARIKAKRGSMYIQTTEVWSPFGYRPIPHNSTFLFLSGWDN
jgi:hypothetical protein